jgi:DNA recombination protein RmuC
VPNTGFLMSMFTILFLVIGVIFFSVLVYFLLKDKVPKHDLALLKAEKLALENKYTHEYQNFMQKIAEQKNALAELRENLQAAKEKIAGLEYEKLANASLKNNLDVLLSELQVARDKTIILETEKTAYLQQKELHIKQMQEMQENLKLQFEALGNKIFGENTQAFKQESQSKISELLLPLKSDIDGFKKKLEESFSAQAKEQHSLKYEIERIVKVNEQMTSQTTNLTKALKGDFRVQGNWGEIILEKILEESGLRRGEDYILQGLEMGLKHPATGQVLKPDVIVKLPEEKHIIIDSKVSLTDYERYCSAEDEPTRTGHLKQFIFSIKKHVNDLEQRRYQDVDNLKTPEFVLMFMPIEGAFSLAIKQERELHSFAWGRKVVIVCPATLFATLKTISSIWRLELQHKHALEIAKQGGLLYDKIASFVLDMQKLGNQLTLAQATYTAAMSKLHEGKGNILIRTEHLQTLGAKASKNLLRIIPQAFDGPVENERTVAPHDLPAVDVYP